MTERAQTVAEDRRRMLRVEMTTGLSLLLAAVFVAAVALPDHRGDGTYYAASRLLLQNRFGPEVYDNDWMMAQVGTLTEGRILDVFRPNPPTAALLALPVAWLPPLAARRAWAGLNAALLLATVALIYRVAFAGKVEAAPRAVPWLLGLAFALFAAPIIEGFQHGQAYILLLALFTLAWWGLRTRRAAVAGLALALALMLKTSGGPLLLLLALRREWRALGWAGLGAVAIFGLSLPWVGLDTWRIYLTDVLPTAAATPSVAVIAFQSLPGFWAHLFRYDATWNAMPVVNAPALAAILGSLSVLAVLGLSLWRARRASFDPAFGVLAAASVFIVPFAEQHHYTLMALPVLLAGAAWSERRSRWAGLALLAGALLIALPLNYEAPALAAGWAALLAYPRLYGGLLVWAGLLHFVGSARPGGSA